MHYVVMKKNSESYSFIYSIKHLTWLFVWLFLKKENILFTRYKHLKFQIWIACKLSINYIQGVYKNVKHEIINNSLPKIYIVNIYFVKSFETARQGNNCY